MKGIRARLIVQISVLLLMIVLLLEGLFILSVRAYYFSSATETLTTRAVTSATFFNKFLEGYELEDRARYILENLTPEEYARIEVLDPDGKIVIDSFGFASPVTVQTQDVNIALNGGTGTYIGRTPMFDERILAVSIPLKNLGSIIGVLRFSVSAEPLYDTVFKIALNAIAVGLFVILLGFGLSLIIAKRIVDPIEELTRIAKQMATGNFAARAVKQHEDEVGTLAETLNYMSEELSKNEKLKNDFISTVSHELRTPLTSIKGWGETLIVGGLEDEEESLLGLEVITGETNRLIGLVEELLDFSKFQSGEMRLNFQPSDLRGLLEDVEHQYSYRQNTKHIELRVDIPDQPLLVTCDRDRLKQVLVNLIDNAFKFTPPYGAIQLTAGRTDRHISLTVSDNGEGIAPEDLVRVGEKFFKGKSKQSGSGLGLAICKEIIQLHGGRLQIESELQQGTRVTVELPLSDTGE
ncbi:ATP-binding protein [Paenibacillus sp. y28]|uniref:ATP-binding protein n=1 Tax=Paenibacillus sp. y28 TaxID=3129110 RepID=UPI00301803E3